MFPADRSKTPDINSARTTSLPWISRWLPYSAGETFSRAGSRVAHPQRLSVLTFPQPLTFERCLCQKLDTSVWIASTAAASKCGIVILCINVCVVRTHAKSPVSAAKGDSTMFSLSREDSGPMVWTATTRFDKWDSDQDGLLNCDEFIHLGATAK